MGWKLLYLSKSGKVTLMKAALSSISVYYMLLFTIPRELAQGIEKLQRDFFLWGWEGGGGSIWWLEIRYVV